MESVFWFCFVAFLLQCLTITAKRTYIVHMNHHNKPLSYATHHDWYSAHLQSLSSDSDSLLYTYTTAYHGFAASLDPHQADLLRHSDSVLGVYEDTVYTLHTTRTPEFLGLDTQMGLWDGHTPQELNHASQDVIIGVLVTGVWPESKSFDDSGMPDVPSQWRGECELASDFSPQLCNNVCWLTNCFGADILAGMDRAITDGVDVLSLSLGGGSASSYRDTIAIGAFTATAMGIFVSCSAGNSSTSLSDSSLTPRPLSLPR